jgi:hypothetical protein
VTVYRVLGLFVAVCALALLVRRIRRMTRRSVRKVDLLLWDADHRQPLGSWATDEQNDDTTPAVLSPPEWQPHKSPDESRR